MIYYLTRQDNLRPILRIIRDLENVKIMSYEELFHRRKAPLGHYVFADVDRLTGYEREILIEFSDRLREACPQARILNDPRYVLERYPLLRTLQREGINRFGVTRLDGGDRPRSYPVFIRSEDGHCKPDTDLLHSAEELEEAIDALIKSGKVLKRRIAVEFCAEKNEAGYYRKYGCIRIADQIVPQHILESDQWIVKSSSTDRNDQLAKEEMDFVLKNPHREALKKVFDLAHIDFGRADYSIVDGRIQIYEVNTNPRLPSLSKRSANKGRAITERRVQRMQFFNEWFNNAFSKIDDPIPGKGWIRFELPLTRLHPMRQWKPEQKSQLLQFLGPVLKLNPALVRRIPGKNLLRSVFRMFPSM